MFDYDKWQEIFDSLKRHKLRTALTALAVWWGIFMLVILLGAGNGLHNSFLHDFGDDAINSVWIYPGQTSKPWKGLPAGRSIQLTNDDYEAVRTIEGVTHLTGRYYLSGDKFITFGGKALSFSIRSVHPDHLFLENTIMTRGRFLNEMDIRKRRKVCVLGKLVVEDLMPDVENPVGASVNIGGTQFLVVGVFIDEGHENEMRRVYIPITTAQRVFDREDRIHQLMAIVDTGKPREAERIAGRIRQSLAERHNFDPTDDQALYVRNNVEEFQKFQWVFRGIKLFIWFVGIGSIIAGVVGVSNIMLIIVKERTREIGIRKAIGATPGSIVAMILQEAIFLTGVAGYFGLICGFSVVYGLRRIMEANDIDMAYFYQPNVDFLSVLAALLLLVVCGALAGLIPALQAVRVNPVTAIREGG